MKHDDIKKLAGEEFFNKAKVQRNDFYKIINVLKLSEPEGLIRRSKKLSMEDQFLMMLQQGLNNYTYNDVGEKYNVSRSTAYNTIRWINQVLLDYPELMEMLPEELRKQPSNKNFQKTSYAVAS